MELQKVMESRRSVRSYDATKKVGEEQMKELVEAASLAPSWKNSQTARYYCILDEKKIKEFAKNCLPERNAKKAEGAALVVTTFVSNVAGFDVQGNPDNECGNGWGFYDLGLHNQNFVLKAKEMGLDTLIMGLRDSDKIREMLDIPTTETIVAVIAVGYGVEEPKMPKRKTTDEILKFY